MQINLNRVQQEREHFAEQLCRLKREIQELDELKGQLNRVESTREFAAVLARKQEELYRQTEIWKNMERALEELLYCYRQAEEQILEEYEQERLQLPRFSVNSVDLDGYRAEDAHIHICF